MVLLTQEFLNNYPSHPEHMSPLGLFTFYRTYSRFLPKEKRRETWKETVARAISYNVGLQAIHQEKNGLPAREKWLREEAEKLFDNVFNLRQFPSGRTLFVGGTAITDNFPMANFNCSFTNFSKWSDLRELFYLLMLGSGVGIKATKETMKDLPPIRTNATLILSEYKPVPNDYRLEHTDTRFLENGFAKIYVGDSKEGWCDSLNWYIRLLTDPKYENIHTIKISFNSVRPAGERLKTFGGTASGPEPLREMFQGIDDTLKNKIDTTLAPIKIDEKGYGYVRPIHILDMANFIGANVVVGGVRRTAEIFLFDAHDQEVLFAKYGKNGFWTPDHIAQHREVGKQMDKLGIKRPAWFDHIGSANYNPMIDERIKALKHRSMSNNSIVFLQQPPKEYLHLIFQLIKLDAEPGFVNFEQASTRRENMQGLNPCAEILLDSKQQCNLTTINMMAFLKEDGTLDIPKLHEAQELSVRAGIRMTLVDLEMPEWDKIHKRDRLTGCSLTGIQDALAKFTNGERREILTDLNHIANEEAVFYAHALRIPTPLLVTTVKPEGS